MLYRVSDPVLLKGSDSDLGGRSEWVVVGIEGSTLMLMQMLGSFAEFERSMIRGVHTDGVTPSLDFVKRAPTASVGTGGRAVLVA